jgi:hypothetical protein
LAALGWFHLALGVVAFIVGLGLLRGRRWGRVAAMVLACLAILVNFAFIAIYPLWDVTAIILAAITIYAVAAHGSELADAYSSPWPGGTNVD